MPTPFKFNIDDMVQFVDGRQRILRVGYVVAQEEPNEEHPVRGYQIRYRMAETGQMRLVFWAENDVAAAIPRPPKFQKGDKVLIDEGAQSGVVFDAKPMSLGYFEPRYAVLVTGDNGVPDLAWWGETMLTEAPAA